MKKWKRVFIVGMCTLVLSFTVMSTYQQAKEVKAIIGVDDALILITLLASFGIVGGAYVVGNNAEKLYDELEEGYDATRFTLLEGGGGNPDDPEDDDDNINDENGDGKVDAKDIPTFRSLISQYGLAGAIKYTPSILACLAPTIYGYYKGKTADLSASSLSGQMKNAPEYGTNSYPYFVQQYSNGGSYFFVDYYFIPPNSCLLRIATDSSMVSDPVANPYFYRVYSAFSTMIRRYWGSHYDKISGSSKYDMPFGFSVPHSSGFNNPSNNTVGINGLYTNLPVVDTIDEVNQILNRNEVIWTTPELQDTYKNEGDFKRLPMRDPNKAYDIPSQQALEDLDNDMLNNNLTDDERNQLINDFINNLKNPNTDPAPGTQPDSPTNPDPDNPTNPDPDNPTDPGPDNPTDPGPDNPTVPDIGMGGFLADLTTLFPFCIPFDLIRAFSVLASNGDAPVYKIPFNIDYGNFHAEQTWEIDMSDYESVVVVFRLLETLAFIITLIVVTRALIKG